MFDTYDMKYELLIRRAFNIGRTYSHGADADIYRGLGSKKDDNLQYGIRLGQISIYITDAIIRIIENKIDVLSHDNISELEQCISDIYYPDEKIIESVIDIATKYTEATPRS